MEQNTMNEYLNKIHTALLNFQKYHLLPLEKIIKEQLSVCQTIGSKIELNDEIENKAIVKRKVFNKIGIKEKDLKPEDMQNNDLNLIDKGFNGFIIPSINTLIRLMVMDDFNGMSKNIIDFKINEKEHCIDNIRDKKILFLNQNNLSTNLFHIFNTNYVSSDYITKMNNDIFVEQLNKISNDAQLKSIFKNDESIYKWIDTFSKTVNGITLLEDYNLIKQISAEVKQYTLNLMTLKELSKKNYDELAIEMYLNNHNSSEIKQSLFLKPFKLNEQDVANQLFNSLKQASIQLTENTLIRRSILDQLTSITEKEMPIEKIKQKYASVPNINSIIRNININHLFEISSNSTNFTVKLRNTNHNKIECKRLVSDNNQDSSDYLSESVIHNINAVYPNGSNGENYFFDIYFQTKNTSGYFEIVCNLDINNFIKTYIFNIERGIDNIINSQKENGLSDISNLEKAKENIESDLKIMILNKISHEMTGEMAKIQSFPLEALLIEERNFDKMVEQIDNHEIQLSFPKEKLFNQYAENLSVIMNKLSLYINDDNSISISINHIPIKTENDFKTMIFNSREYKKILSLLEVNYQIQKEKIKKGNIKSVDEIVEAFKKVNSKKVNNIGLELFESFKSSYVTKANDFKKISDEFDECYAKCFRIVKENEQE